MPLAVDGLRLGDPKQLVFQRMGAPRETSRGSLEVWKYKDLEVTFQGSNVCRLYGSVLQQGNQALVRSGELAGVVRGRLGEPIDPASLGIQTPQGMELMMYQNETTSLGVFSRQGRVSVVGLSRRT